MTKLEKIFSFLHFEDIVENIVITVSKASTTYRDKVCF